LALFALGVVSYSRGIHCLDSPRGGRMLFLGALAASVATYMVLVVFL
jgi:hypothetical protein